MADDEPFPLPRSGGQTQKVADEHTVGSCMGDERQSIARFFDVPDRQFVLYAKDAALIEELRRAPMDSPREITDRLSTLEPAPAFGGRTPLFFAIGRFSLLRRIPLPDWATNLLKPRLDNFTTPLSVEYWCGGLSRTKQWRDVDVVEVLVLESVGETTGLAMTARGERWIVLAQSLANPLGLGMADERQLHGGKASCRMWWSVALRLRT